MTKINTLVNQVSVIKDNLKVAIRNKGVSVSDSDPFSSYPTKIGNITTEVNNQDKTVTENGIVYPDAGYTGLGQVEVNVPSGDIHNQDITVTENGTYNAEQGYTGLGTVVVDVEGGQVIHNQDKVALENGTVFPDAGYTGLGKVTVNVQGETDIVTALNKSGREINVGDKVWINNKDGHYTLVPFGLSSNFNKGGEVLIDVESGEASNFNYDNWIELFSLPSSTDYEFVFKFTTGSDITSFQNIFCFSPVSEMYIENGALRVYSETTQNSISCGSVEQMTTYYGKVVISNGMVTLSYSTDGTTYIGEASAENTDTEPQERKIGNGINWERYFRGVIDLSESYINIHNVRYWTPKFTDVTSDTVTGTSKDFIWNGQSGQVYIGDIIEAQLGSKTITVNGTYRANDDLLDGYDTVTINVAGGGSEPVLAVKTVTQNGTYNAADDSADGYSSVTVSVGGGSGSGNYGGLSMSYSQQEGYLPVIRINGGVLADYSSYINSCAGVLAPSGYHYIDSADVYNDFELFGNVEVNQATGAVRGCDYDNYLEINRPFFPQDKSWEIKLKIRTPEITNSEIYPIFNNFYEEPRSLIIGIQDWRFKCWLTSNSDGWNIFDYHGDYIVQSDTIYYLRLSYDSGYYNFAVSEDDENWQILASTESNNLVAKSYLSFGGYTESWHSFGGTVYLDESYIKVDNKLWWNGRTHEYYAGLLADGVVDDGTAKTYNLFWNNGFVLDTAQEKQDWEWCGLVGVPAHTVNTIEPDSEAELVGKDKISLSQYVNDNYHRDILLVTRETEDFPQVVVTFTQSDLYSNELRKIGIHTDARTVAFPNLTTISGHHGLFEAFANDEHLISFSFPVLASITGENALGSFANNDHKITTAIFPELVSATGSAAFRGAFVNCIELSQVSFPKLTTVAGYETFCETFWGTGKLKTVTFPVLNSINGEAIFRRILGGSSEKVINFPALTTSSFGSWTNQFDEMFRDSSWCIAHFPYEVRHILENWYDIKDRNLGSNSSEIEYDLRSGLITFQNSGNCVIARDNEMITKAAGLYYTKEGNPTIDEQNYTLTNFSRWNYIVPNYRHKYTRTEGSPYCFHKSWEAKIKVRTPTTTDCRVCIFGSAWEGNGTFFLLDYGHFGFLNGLDGWFNDWNGQQAEGSYTGALEYSAETDYWVKFGWNSETYEYYLEYSTDGENYTKDISYYSNREVRIDAPQRLGAWGWDDEGASNGAIIYLDTFSLISNGKEQIELCYPENVNSDRFKLGNTTYTAYDEVNNKLLFGSVDNVTDQEVRNVTIDMSSAGNKLTLVLNKDNLSMTLSSEDGLVVTPVSETARNKVIYSLDGNGRVITYKVPRTATTATTTGTVTLTSTDQTENITIQDLPARDFTVVGTPTISNDNILSGCSENDYLTTEITDLPEYGFEFIAKVKSFTYDTGNYKQAFSREDSANGIHYQFCKIWDDHIGIHTRIDDQWEDDSGCWGYDRDYTGYVWYAYKQYEWGFEHYYIFDDGYTLDTLPALPENWDDETQWIRCDRRDWKNLMVNGHYEIGHNSNWPTDFWPTEIDLNEMVIRDSSTGEVYWRAINEAPVQQNQEPEMVTLTVYGGRTRTSYGSGEGHIETFTINGQTYTWNSDFSAVTQGESGMNMSKYLTIQVPANTNLPWTATANVNTTVTPSSGTLNISDDYTLNITYYEEIEDEAL